MSADNYIYYDQEKKELWECVASCITKNGKDLDKQKIMLIGKPKNMKQLLTMVSKLELETEYGLSFSLWCKN